MVMVEALSNSQHRILSVSTATFPILSSPDSEAASRDAAAASEDGSGKEADSTLEYASSVSTCGRQASSWLRIRPDIVLLK